nr:uncharacterized protein LOC116431636 isoform X2 [Nomia melanderi]
MIGKFVTKIIQSLPTWEVTKYYGRCKFMPGSFRNELECEEIIEPKNKNNRLKQKAKRMNLETETSKKKEFNIKKNDDQCLNSYTTEQKYQEECTKKKQEKMKHAR